MREYHLAKQGYEAVLDARRRQEARWMSLLLSTQCSKPVTEEQLLGEEPSGEETMAAAEKRLERYLAEREQGVDDGG